MAPPRPPAKRRRISVLEAVVVVVGFLAIIGYNRLNIVRLQRSLPNVNDKIVGEWKAERGTEHLVFRSDESVSMTVPAPAAEGSESAAEGSSGPPPVTGKYKLTQGGRIYVQLLNGKKYHTTISPINPNRFDLIDSDTDAVTTYDRVNAPEPGAAKEAPATPSAAEAVPAAPPSSAEEASPPPAAAEAETPAAPPASATEEAPPTPASPPVTEASPPPASTGEAPAAPGAAPAAEETPPAQAPKSPAAQKKKHR